MSRYKPGHEAAPDASGLLTREVKISALSEFPDGSLKLIDVNGEERHVDCLGGIYRSRVLLLEDLAKVQEKIVTGLQINLDAAKQRMDRIRNEIDGEVRL